MGNDRNDRHPARQENHDPDLVSAVNTPSLNQWLPASNLKPGERLKTSDGTLAVADGGTTPKVHDGWMWDLTVPGNNDHDFYVLTAEGGDQAGHGVGTGGTAVLVHNNNDECSIVPDVGSGPTSLRQQYMGRTPDKFSRTGRAVVERMRGQGLISGDGPLLRGNPNGLMLSTDSGWQTIDSTVDMAHTTDAVSWWNNTGRFFGPKAPEVRQFMLNPDNYVLQPSSINRSLGAQLGESYQPPAAPNFADPSS
jgi:hypothetical protein